MQHISHIIKRRMENIIINDDFRNHDFPNGENVYIISDPPYNQNYHYNHYKDEIEGNEYAKMMEDAFGHNQSIVISYPEQTINILGKVLGGCSDSVAWVYNSNTAKQHRLVTWWGCKPDFRKVGQPYKNPTDKRIAKRIAEGKIARLYDWWEINQVKNVSKKDNPHSCPIPYELAKRIILISTNPGDTVVDPFCGSGTILKAAKDTGRKYIGYEIDKEYWKYSLKLLNK